MQNSSTDVFDDFDDEQEQNILGSLQVGADEEPVRRGASRANSVRFDVSAIQGSNWAQGSRSSGEFGPIRPHSGIGSHPMTERSLSHKSDGRHSSGHSVHSMPSGRTSSLGLDANFLLGGQDDDSPLDIPDPPPGLFILGPVPSIIRCWLTTNFSHNALLYAVVCTGSQRSLLDFALVKELGLIDQINKDSTSRYNIRLPVYLPEAIITQPALRSNSPAPQLPALTVDFEITGFNQRSISDRKKGIQVFLGSDTLRAHNADILFSQNLMTLYGDDRQKLSVPFVRPEDENLFKHLSIVNGQPEKNELKATAPSFTPTESKTNDAPTPNAVVSALVCKLGQSHKSSRQDLQTPSTEPQSPDSNLQLQIPPVQTGTSSGIGNASDSEMMQNSDTTAPENDPISAAGSSDPTRRESSSGIWGSWRHGSVSMNGSDNGREPESTSGYQRASRGGRSMKVLKPSKSISSTTAPSRSSSGARTGAAYEAPAPSRSSGESRGKSQVGQENVPLRWESKRMNSEDQKGNLTVANLPRTSNPIGGASAFAWMNPSKPKASATTAE